jgi:hypothetical protein
MDTTKMKLISHVQNTFLVMVSEIMKQNDVMLFTGNNTANTPDVTQCEHFLCSMKWL